MNTTPGQEGALLHQKEYQQVLMLEILTAEVPAHHPDLVLLL